MEKLSYLTNEQAETADGQREALQWLARRLHWEQRLGELRPGATAEKQAA
jgi:hypothetical protein